MNVLLSIKPEFAEKILQGEKGYEFRKTGFRDPSAVEIVIMYASSPVQKIVGYFTIKKVVESQPDDLWNRFGTESGLERFRFMDYFEEAETGYAIEIGELQRLSIPLDPSCHLDDFRPPVSFQYVNGDLKFVFDRPTTRDATD